MSNSIPAPNYTQIPNVILDEWIPKLNEVQAKCILFICRKTFGWHKQSDNISISQFVEGTGKCERAIQGALNYLVSLGLLIKKETKTRFGDPGPSNFSLNISTNNPEFKEKIGGAASCGGVVQPDAPTKTRPRSSQTFAKGKDYEKTMPFADAKGSHCEKPKGSKYPLKKSQESMLELLRTLDLECDDGLLYILIRSHSEQALIDSIAHLRNADEREVKFKKSRIAFFRDTLKGNQKPVTDQCLKNKEYATWFAKQNGWNSLIIKDKYCYCSSSGVEIPNDWDAERFQNRIYECFERYRGMC